MAERTKKTQTKAPAKSAAKTTAKSTTAGQGSRTRGSGKSRASKKKISPGPSYLLALAGALLVLLAFVPGQTVWRALRIGLFGLLGWVAYLMGAMLLYLAWYRAHRRATVLYWETGVLVLLLSALPVAFSGADYTGEGIWPVLQSSFQAAKAGGWQGGVAGSILGGSLSTLCGHPAANVLILLLLAGDLYLVFPVAFSYVYQSMRSLAEDGREYMAANREKRAEAARRSAELQAENDRRRAARMERESAANAQRRPVQVDIPLGPDVPPAPAAPAKHRELSGIFVGGPFGKARTQAKPAAPPLEVVEPEHIDIGPGGTFGLDPLKQALSNGPKEQAAPKQPLPLEPDISAALGGEFEIPLEPAAPAQEPTPGSGSSELDSLIQRAAEQGSRPQAAPADPALPPEPTAEYRIPPLDLLERPVDQDDRQAAAEMRKNADVLVKTLESFGVKTKVLDICRGPSVTRYELQPLAGVKISRITSLADDIALNLAKAGVRIEAPIPGKPAVGIEVPNDHSVSVSIRGILESPAYAQSTAPLTIALGKDIAGTAQVADLSKMPHLLIAGSTGSGKSVCVNSIIISFLYRASPEDVKLILIDPKVVELAEYNGIPHLLMPVVTEPRKAAGALGSAVAEMERRYHLFAENNVRDIKTFNKLAETEPELEKLPYIAIIIDELADLMMVSGKEVEDYICRIAQKARAAGMHLIVATQRPSVDVITGLIKANIPSRIAFAVSSQVDSRTILDGAGAEKLLGMGDMLFLPVGAPKPTRIQGTYVKDEEITAVLDYIKQSGSAQYNEGMIAEMEKRAAADPKDAGGGEGGSQNDAMFEQAVEAVIEAGQASTSMLQRRCKLGYARAARIMDEMEQAGVIGPYEGAKPRQVLISRQQWIEKKMMADAPAPEGEEH